MLTEKEIYEGNKMIAEFLGWFQDDKAAPYLYYEKDEVAVRVAFDIRSSPYRQLPFHHDWNYLMLAVTKLEDMGLCLHTANRCKAKDVKNNLADHIGFNMLDDYYCCLSGRIEEEINGDNITRYFDIQRLDMERLESIFKTIVMFLEYYNDKTVRIVNVSNNKVKRVERK